MKKIYIIILLAAAIIFILFDLFLWINYRKRIISPIANIYYPTNYNQNINSAANLNITVPTNLNQPLNQNLNVPVNGNFNVNALTNINAAPISTSETVLQIKNIIFNNSYDLSFNYRQIRAEIDDLSKTQDIEPALISIANEQDNFKQRFLALNLLFATEYPKPEKNMEVIETFKYFLNDNDFQIKLLVAQYLVMLGYKEGFPAIIEGLVNDDFAAYSDPLTVIKSSAYGYLKQLTRKDFGLDYAAWSAWWDQYKNTLQWDAANQYYH